MKPITLYIPCRSEPTFSIGDTESAVEPTVEVSGGDIALRSCTVCHEAPALYAIDDPARGLCRAHFIAELVKRWLTQEQAEGLAGGGSKQ